MDDIGFYNKYLLLNNSYLVKHIVWNTVKKNKESKNLNKIIDKELAKTKITQSKNAQCKTLSKPKVSNLLRSSFEVKKLVDKTTNTLVVNKVDKDTNTEIKRRKFLNNENASLFNRLKNYKN